MTHSNKNPPQESGDPADARLFRIDHSQIRPLAFFKPAAEDSRTWSNNCFTMTHSPLLWDVSIWMGVAFCTTQRAIIPGLHEQVQDRVAT
jgi:hypothetical protein